MDMNGHLTSFYETFGTSMGEVKQEVIETPDQQVPELFYYASLRAPPCLEVAPSQPVRQKRSRFDPNLPPQPIPDPNETLDLLMEVIAEDQVYPQKFDSIANARKRELINRFRREAAVSQRVKKLQCVVCRFGFYTRSSLKKHFKSMHHQKKVQQSRRPDPKHIPSLWLRFPHICFACGIHFEYRDQLIDHYITH